MIKAAFVAATAIVTLSVGSWGGVRAQEPTPEQVLKGKITFAMNCKTCHAIRGDGGNVGPDLSRHGIYKSPIFVAAIMWNHMPAMTAVMQEKGVAQPKLTGEEMSNLFAYLHKQTASTIHVEALPASVDRGRELFQGICGKCHGELKEGETERVAPLLAERVPPTEMELAARMWAHGLRMAEVMQERGIERPKLTGKDMRDVYAFLRKEFGPGE